MLIIKPKSAIAFTVGKGDTIRITDVEGTQIADFVCFNLHDHLEFFSQANTRANNRKLRISTGDILYSNRNNPMFTIVADTVGVHDLLYSPCNSFLYETFYNTGPRNGCLENLAQALAPHGISESLIPDPFNIFMNTSIDENFRLSIGRALSKPGDYVDVRAEADCLVAISSCAHDLNEGNGGVCTPIQVEFRN